MKVRILEISALALALTGCSTRSLVGRHGLEVVGQAALPAPNREDLILQQRSYVIGPLDRVAIDVYGAAELSRTVQVDASGTLTLPLVGTVEAAGKTPAELSSVIADRLRGRFVRDPQVIVTADTVNQVITVDGEVKKPGNYPVTGRMTLMRAVASAEGLSEFASTRRVVVFRRVNSKDMAALYDLQAIRQGVYSDPEIYANDVILVGDSAARRVFQAVIQASPLLSAPLIAILR